MKQDTATKKKAGNPKKEKKSSSKSSIKTASPKKVEEDDNNENNEEGQSLFEVFFIQQLQDIYYAEQQQLKALEKLEEACTTEELKEAFDDHRHETEKQLKRLQKVFSLIGQPATAKKSEAIEGIVKECEEIIKQTQEGSMTRDAALIMGAQKMEHYEIATYGGLVQFAITLGLGEVADLLDKTLEEEEEADWWLTEIAENYINIEAEEEDKYSWNKSTTREIEIL